MTTTGQMTCLVGPAELRNEPTRRYLIDRLTTRLRDTTGLPRRAPVRVRFTTPPHLAGAILITVTTRPPKD